MASATAAPAAPAKAAAERSVLGDQAVRRRSFAGRADAESGRRTAVGWVDRPPLEIKINKGSEPNGAYSFEVPQRRTDQLFVARRVPIKSRVGLVVPKTFFGRPLDADAMNDERAANKENAGGHPPRKQYPPLLMPVNSGDLGYGLPGKNRYAQGQEVVLQERIRQETRSLYDGMLKGGDSKSMLVYRAFADIELLEERVAELKER